MMTPVGGSTFIDSINPYSGELMIHAVDVHLPGKGGLDLVIQRYYRSHVWNRGDNHPDGTFDLTFHTAGTDVRDNMGGNGWQMHMGKLRSSGLWTTTPPTFITASGSEHVFYSTGDAIPTTEATARISPSRWKLWRDETLPGWKLRTTTGRLYEIADRVQYFINGCWGGPCTTFNSSIERNSYIGMTGAEYHQVTAIENLHGDRIEIHYDPTDANITKIVDTWDREVELSYERTDSSGNDGDCASGSNWTDPGPVTEILVEAKDGTDLQKWEYVYDDYSTSDHERYDVHIAGCPSFVGIIRRPHRLVTVKPPEGDAWTFTYVSTSKSEDDGRKMLEKVTTPRGASTTYTYDSKAIDVGHDADRDPIRRAVVTRKTIQDGATTLQTWDYDYPDVMAQEGHTTTVSGPEGYSASYRFHGWTDPSNLPQDFQNVRDDDLIWRNGLPIESTVTFGGQTTTETTEWQETSIVLSATGQRCTRVWNNAYLDLGDTPSNPRCHTGVHFVRPTERTRTITRVDGGTWTTVSSNFDAYGNPGSIVETSSVPGQASLTRTTTTTYWYEPSNHLLAGLPETITRVPGGTTTYAYSDTGLQTSRITNGIESRTRYFTASQSKALVETSTLENGSNDIVTTFRDYVYGVPTSESVGGKVQIDRTVDGLGRVLSESDGRGHFTDYVYDDLGRATRITPPIGHATTLSYSPSGDTVTIDRAGYTLVYTFDVLGRLIRVENQATGDVTEHAYDDLGQRTRTTRLPGGENGTTVHMDALGRVTSVVHPDGYSITYAYDDLTTTITDELSRSTELTYQSFGSPTDTRLAEIVDAMGNTWSYGYSPSSGLLTSIDAPGTAGDRSFVYNSEHLLDSETHPESGTVDYEYHVGGQIWRRLRSGGGTTETITYTYDAANRLVDVDGPGTAHDTTIRYTGTRCGGFERCEVEMGTGTDRRATIFEYDANGRLTLRRTEFQHGASTSSSLSFDVVTTYDAFDRVETVTYPSGRVVHYDYDDAHRTTRIHDGGVQHFVNSATYHATGGLDTLTVEGGVTTTFGRDGRYRVDSVSTARAGATLLDIDLLYDAVGNVDTWTGGGTLRSFGYDALNRMTSANAPALWGSQVFAFDALGNRTSRTHADGVDTYSYNPKGQLTGITGTQTQSYGYDDFGRLRSAPFKGFQEPPEPPAPAPFLVAEKVDSIAFDEDGDGLVEPFDRIGYTVTIENIGNLEATGIVFDDTVGDHTILDPATVTTDTGTVVSTEPEIRVDVGTLAAQATATIYFEVVLENPLTEGVNHVRNQGRVTSVELGERLTDDPDTAVIADATATSVHDGAEPPPDNTPINAITSLHRSGGLLHQGGVVVGGYALSATEIDLHELTVYNDRHNPSEMTAATIGQTFYGTPLPEVCDYWTQSKGYEFPNCPNIGFWALMDTRKLADVYPLDPNGYFTRYTVRNYARTSGPPFNSYGREASFKLYELGDDEQPSDLSQPHIGFDPDQRVIWRERSPIRGWAMDRSGIVSIEFRVRFTNAEGVVETRTLAPSDIAYGQHHPTACDTYSTWRDPNCDLASLAGTPLAPVGWYAIVDTTDFVQPSGMTLVVEATDSEGRTKISEQAYSIEQKIGHDQSATGEPLAIPGGVRLLADYDIPSDAGPGHHDQSVGNSLDNGSSYNLRPNADVDFLPGNHSDGWAWVGDIEAGEWLAYMVDIDEPGYYRAIVTYWGSDAPDGTLHLELDGAPITDSLEIPAPCQGTQPHCPYGAVVFEDVYLQGATWPEMRTLKIVFDSDITTDTLWRTIRFERQSDPPPQPFQNQVRSVPGTIQAELFDTSPIFLGQKVGTWDRTLGNQAAVPYREHEWVDAGSEGLMTLVQDIELAERLDYTLDVTAAGTYDVELAYRNASADPTWIDVVVDGRSEATVALPSTGGAWKVGVISDVEVLRSGIQTVRFVGGHGNFALNAFEITEAKPCPATANDDHLGGFPAYRVAHGDSVFIDWIKLTANDLPDGFGNVSTPEITVRPAGTLTPGTNVLNLEGVTYEPPAAYQPTDSFEYSVYSDGNPECADTATVHLVIDPPPAPSVDFTVTCAGLHCTFDASDLSSGHELSYAWELGDGTRGVGASTTHVYAQWLQPAVRLTATDLAGTASSLTKTVPMVRAVDDQIVSTVGGSIEFPNGEALVANDLGTGRRFGSVVTEPLHGEIFGLEFDPGFVYVPDRCPVEDHFEYTVLGPPGSAIQDVGRVDVVIDPPRSSPDFTVTCDAQRTCQFSDTAQAAQGYWIVSWDFGDGSAPQLVGAATIEHTFTTSANGPFSVTLTVEDGCGRSASVVRDVVFENDAFEQILVAVSAAPWK